MVLYYWYNFIHADGNIMYVTKWSLFCRDKFLLNGTIFSSLVDFDHPASFFCGFNRPNFRRLRLRHFEFACRLLCSKFLFSHIQRLFTNIKMDDQLLVEVNGENGAYYKVSIVWMYFRPARNRFPGHRLLPACCESKRKKKCLQRAPGCGCLLSVVGRSLCCVCRSCWKVFHIFR